MEQAKAIFAPTFPVPILIGLTLACAILLVIGLRRVHSMPARFAVLVIWLRILFDAAPFFTIQPLVAGISPNAMLSLATIGIGLLLLRPRDLAMAWLLPLYASILIAVLSFAANGWGAETIDFCLRILYLVTLTAVILEAARRDGSERLLWGFIIVLGSLVLLQLAAVALGMQKLTVSDNSVAYTGGFNHEANYSIMTGMALVCIMLLQKSGPMLKFALYLPFLAAMLAANYRTAIIAFFLPLAYVIFTDVNRWIAPRLRPVFVVALALAGIAAVATSGPIALGDRWVAVTDIVAHPTSIIRAPDAYSREEIRAASGRMYLFGLYYDRYDRASGLNKLIGFGSQSWTEFSKVYAQNTLLTTLVEFGLFGVAAVIAYWIMLLLLAARAAVGIRGSLVAVNVGLIVLNQSTMPMNLLEGIQLYALLGGLAAYHRVAAPGHHRRAEARRARYGTRTVVRDVHS